jgi:K+ transporter
VCGVVCVCVWCVYMCVSVRVWCVCVCVSLCVYYNNISPLHVYICIYIVLYICCVMQAVEKQKVKVRDYMKKKDIDVDNVRNGRVDTSVKLEQVTEDKTVAESDVCYVCMCVLCICVYLSCV